MNLRLAFVSLLGLILLLSTSACSTKTTASLSENIPYTIYSLKELPSQLQDSAKEMQRTKELHGDKTPASTLFYTNNTNYVLLTTGWKPTGGYSIRVNRISADDDEATIYARDIAPAKGAMVEQVITVPLLALSISKNIKSVRLIWE